MRIFFSALCSQTPSIYVPLLMSDTKFHTHTVPQAVMHTYPPQRRTYVVVTVPCLPQPTQLHVLSWVVTVPCLPQPTQLRVLSWVVTVPYLPQPTQLRVLSYVCCGYCSLPSAADPVACPFLSNNNQSSSFPNYKKSLHTWWWPYWPKHVVYFNFLIFNLKF
jgi:hypothetical protein